MTEKIIVNGKEVWLVIEPREATHTSAHSIPTEYFIAYYALQEPGVYTSPHEPGKTPGTLFAEKEDEPILFLSPVAAVEYAVEKLPGIVM
ncbi:hypothetical protein SAMN05421788_1011085 [Filimonas lacunae]|uniref:Uncharacterized protein n=1 Tax=Filimonas lacunae TaxID=477680 RepID=A0A173MPQ3_9BACT|nr:hypothetical protein [Filimonas lacunae]BAV09653.1 hypothetical protein FLA_5704 [Filimonas lacunae]SIS76605.1 hypothetical protein SAMN05421788_1011085 [Filimonas lacunae]